MTILTDDITHTHRPKKTLSTKKKKERKMITENFLTYIGWIFKFTMRHIESNNLYRIHLYI